MHSVHGSKWQPIWIALVAVAWLGSTPPAGADVKTWNGNTSTNWEESGNWDGGLPGAGDDVVVPSGTTRSAYIPAGTNPVSGAYASLSISNGATVYCLGNTGAVNAASGGTTANPHGIGVTLFATNATLNGTLSAVGKGFPGDKGPGYYGNSGGATHGGRGTSGTALWTLFDGSLPSAYGSVIQPTELGSGGQNGADRAGGGAIRLVIQNTLTVNGTIDASAPMTTRCGSGGSIWLSMSNFYGNGVIKAEGGTPTATDSCGGGGRIALDYTNSTFAGIVSVAGGSKTTVTAQPGTLWEPKRFAGKAGTPDAPVAILITNSYQYYFPDSAVTNSWNLTVSNAWFEAHQGSMRIGNLVLTNGSFGYDCFATNSPWTIDMAYLDITNQVRLTGKSVAYLGAQRFVLSDLFVGTNSVLKLRGNSLAVNTNSGGTVSVPHGAGATIACPNATVNGLITAIGDGFPASTGPGVGTGTDGSAYGGQGSGASSKPYGKLAEPSALGSGNLSTPANARPGGGVVRLIVSGTLAVNGTIDASGPDGARCGSGGSVWLTASNLTGGGTMTARGGGSGSSPSAGGGGRIALSAVSNSFVGSFSVAGGTTTSSSPSKTGTLFRCTAPAFGCCDPGFSGPSLATDFAVQSNGVYVTRQVTKWAKSFQWTDDSRDVASNALNNVAQYILSGLPANTGYAIYTNGALLTAPTNSGLSGALSLSNIVLQPAVTVLVKPFTGNSTLILVR